MLSQLKKIAAQLKQEFQVYRLVLRHPDTPIVAKILLGLAIGYVLMPFDLIPDFIPVIGQLDDLVIVPILVYVALKMIPDALVNECRERVKENNRMSNIDQFVAGYERFHENYFVGDTPLFGELSQGQNPSTMIIACSDSRVDPAIVMDAKPGDLFVVRNVANLVPPYEKGGGYHGVSAALEFGVCGLGVEHIIVMGHRQCGGIKALTEGVPEGIDGEFIRPWVSIASHAHTRVKADFPNATPSEVACQCELAGIIVSLENLSTFPFIKSRIDAGTLTLHGWYFDIETGEMSSYDPKTLKFSPLSSSKNLTLDF